MKIFGSCLVRNEVDIIVETLTIASEWCDCIIVDDNGSDDGTWEMVQELARSNKKIIAWRSKRQPYGDHLRGDPFREFRHLSEVGDWWTKLDADERYVDDPRQFLAKVPRWHHVVAACQFQYYLTKEDLSNDKGKLFFPKEGTPSVLDGLHYYRCEYAEARFFRYRPKLIWPKDVSWPKHIGVIYPRLIRNRHYQYRSPEQMKMRWKIRQNAIAEGCINFGHIERLTGWEDWVVSSESCLDDRDPNPWQIDYAKLPRVTEKPLQRVLKLIAHGLGVWA